MQRIKLSKLSTETQAAIKKELALTKGTVTTAYNLLEADTTIIRILEDKVRRAKKINKALYEVIPAGSEILRYVLTTKDSLELFVDNLTPAGEKALEELGFRNKNVGKGQPRMFENQL